MARTYYQIELTARQLTVLLLLLGAAMVAAFVLGYGAAVATRTQGEGPPVLASMATPTPVEERIITPVPPAESTGEGKPSAPTPAAVVPTPTKRAPTPRPTATHRRPAPTHVRPTPTHARRSHARPKPTPKPTVLKAGLWVQVLAVTRSEGIGHERKRLERLGFPRSHQRLIKEKRKDGRTLYRLQIGPFPDQESAMRVRQRMRKSGYRGAWIAPQ